ncbi:glycosyltransferase family 61 protein [Methylobacterium nodulans]|uniref:Capsular polysaccharide biosynthesis protein-like protein n=1 Tax=Methylobacterium nodulans (strain LMG 21967 / CNCM I-2342 / ORS 2060) TaxID=460265 RepID=B8IAE2_METNO|nr:glycosyltransferase family 61 protein [Methylobacterium nodulans]ACL59205.1 Capsular polysaccharide biosynthesis protein-like protein [Methylobacterium nodulans ORS 2060]
MALRSHLGSEQPFERPVSYPRACSRRGEARGRDAPPAHSTCFARSRTVAVREPRPSFFQKESSCGGAFLGSGLALVSGRAKRYEAFSICCRRSKGAGGACKRQIANILDQKHDVFVLWADHMKLFDHSGTRNSKYLSEKICKSIVFERQYARHGCAISLSNSNSAERHYSALCQLTAQTTDVGFYFVRDAILRGSGFAIQNGTIIDACDLIPSYVRDQISQQNRWDLVGDRNPPIALETPVLVLSGDSHKVYGHWLVDIFPRAWLYKQCFGEPLPGTKVALPVDTPDYAIDRLVNYFDFSREDIVHYRVDTLDIKAENLIMPSLLHVDHCFHPAMNLFVSYLIARAARIRSPVQRRTPRRIFVSRQMFRSQSSSYNRQIANEEEVIDLVRTYGYDIIYPEQFEWPEQIHIFANAESIIGEAGSGLHNAIFSDFGTRVICINPVNQLQGTIAGLRRQKIIYIKPDDQRNEREHVDMSKLREAITLINS